MNNHSRVSVLIILLAMFLLEGCASVARFANEDEKKEIKAGIYFATKMDVGLIRGAFNDSESNWFQGVAIIALPFAIIDLPFSIITDTIMLPYDLYKISGYEEDIEFWDKFSKNKKNSLTMLDYLNHTGVAGLYTIHNDVKYSSNEDHLKIYYDVAKKTNGKKGSSKVIDAFVSRAKDSQNLKNYLCESMLSEMGNSKGTSHLYGITRDGYHTSDCILRLAEAGVSCRLLLNSRLLSDLYFRKCYLENKSKYQILLANNPSAPIDIHEKIYETVYREILASHGSLRNTPVAYRDPIDSLARFTQSEKLIRDMFTQGDSRLLSGLLRNPKVTGKIKEKIRSKRNEIK